jgi:DNA-directed RNA polymerase specialized sigma24 family protein
VPDFTLPIGADSALSEFFTALYGDLRRLAHARLKRAGAPTLLDTTALVHESYLRFQSRPSRTGRTSWPMRIIEVRIMSLYRTFC